MRRHFVDRPEDLVGALGRIDVPTVGVDVERADAPRYFRTAALIQVGTSDHVVLVDAVALAPVPLLSDFLATRTSLLHALTNDLDPMRAVGVEVGEVEDTAVAAALLGLPTGLDPLLTELLGIELAADKERFQRADWERRPLPDDMAAYAAEDVAHLTALWDELAARLDDTGRRGWYDEELAVTVEAAFDDARDWTRTRGAGKLSAEQRAILRELWEEREHIAREFDIAPNRVLRESTLVALAQDPADHPRDLVRRNQRRGRPSPPHAERLHEAQQRGQSSDPEPRPTGVPWRREMRDAYDAMRHARARVAEEVGIDAGVLCPSRSLWTPIRAGAGTPEELCDLTGLRRWQRDLLTDVLWDAYTDALAPDPPEAAADTGSDELTT